MRETKNYCDRCKKELKIKGNFITHKLFPYDNGSILIKTLNTDIELCEKCNISFLKWCNSEEEE